VRISGASLPKQTSRPAALEIDPDLFHFLRGLGKEVRRLARVRFWLRQWPMCSQRLTGQRAVRGTKRITPARAHSASPLACPDDSISERRASFDKLIVQGACLARRRNESPDLFGRKKSCFFSNNVSKNGETC